MGVKNLKEWCNHFELQDFPLKDELRIAIVVKYRTSRIVNDDHVDN